VDDGALRSRVFDTEALRGRLESGGVEQGAGFRQLLVVRRHGGKELFLGLGSRFRVLVGLHNDHESHRRLSCWFRIVSEPALYCSRTANREIDTPSSTSARTSRSAVPRWPIPLARQGSPPDASRPREWPR